MRYDFDCYEHGVFEKSFPIAEGPPAVVTCPECGDESIRIWHAAPDIWHTQGAHKTDYDATGDRLEKLNTNWSKKYGEPPPPPAKDIKRNASDIQ